MTVDRTTGEITAPLTEQEAERLTTRISLKLDAMADTYVGVMPLIREAIERQAHAALGYRSVGAYVSDRFGGSLAKLGMDVRREVVRELTEAGLSTRAIAPVVGVSHETVNQDRTAVNHLTPEPVTGVDGKTYTRRPEPEQVPSQAVSDYLDDDQGLEEKQFAHAFAKALVQATRYREFDPERVAAVCGPDLLEALDDIPGMADRYVASVKKARSGLRVVRGGRA